MRILVPIYYPSFRCIASACCHTCCAGWDITVDSAAAARYLALSGPLGEEIRGAMVTDGDGDTVFRLRGDGRCPFLNGEGLCRIILGLGEEALCQTCADHPRWRSFFSSFTETGLGMACEEAARLILTEKRRAVMIPLGDDGEASEQPGEDEEALLVIRERILEILWDRTHPLPERLDALEEKGFACRTGSPARWRERLLSLERMDEKWAAALASFPADGAWEAEKDLPLEQAAVYFVMRHLPGALEDGMLRERCALAVLLTRLLNALSGESGTAEAARMLSSEIEYSDRNVPELLGMIREDEQTGAL